MRRNSHAHRCRDHPCRGSSRCKGPVSTVSHQLAGIARKQCDILAVSEKNLRKEAHAMNQDGEVDVDDRVDNTDLWG